jgi:hypothetical protein
MQNLKTENKQVAIAPLVATEQTATRTRGLDMSDMTTVTLVKSTVTFDSDKYKKGDIVYFRSDFAKSAMFKQKIDFGDIKFLLIPEEFVILSESQSNAK